MIRTLLLLLAWVVGGHVLSWSDAKYHREPSIERLDVNTYSFEDAIDNNEIKPRTTCTCGVKSLSKIVGGEYANLNEYPWMAALCSTKSCNFQTHLCGGSLINDQYILTVAHCIQGKDVKDITVSLGDHDLNSTTETDSLNYEVEDLILHQSYDPSTSANDIALIKLKTKVEITDKVSPICLPPQKKSYDDKTVYVIGWGDVSTGGGDYSTILKEAALKVVSRSECEQIYGLKRTPEKMICAKGDRTDTCMKDSGGPLMYIDSSGFYDQIGITCTGMSCADRHYPSLYTKVNRYLKWIKRNTNGATFCENKSPN